MRYSIYEQMGPSTGFEDLRVLHEEATDLVVLYYDTPQASAYGRVLGMSDAIAFLERMQNVMGPPWTSRAVNEAIGAIAKLQEGRGAAAKGKDEEDEKPASWAKVG